jgi:radical SAM enzyme (TIGR01210 family)
MWFQESDEGLTLFIVFYTLACRWSRCLGCNLPSKSSLEHIGFKDIGAQIDHVFSDPKVIVKKKEIRKVILSNNGSVLDENTFSSNALMHFIYNINLYLPNLSVVTMETRPEYVDVAELEFIARALKEGDTPTMLEIAIGFEAFDEKIRNEHFNKGLSLDVFQKQVDMIAKHGFRLKCYFMQKPVPGMTDDEAVRDIMNSIDFLSSLAKEHKVRINMHINPTYAAYGTMLGESFNKGEFEPPRLIDVARAARHAEGKHITVFLGLFDEGLAVEGGSFIRQGDEDLISKMEQFNMTQDFSLLKNLLMKT